MNHQKGVPCSSGIGIGFCWPIEKLEVKIDEKDISEDDVQREFEQFQRAKKRTGIYLQSLLKKVRHDKDMEASEILESHLELLNDLAFSQDILEQIGSYRKSASWVVGHYLEKIKIKMEQEGEGSFREKGVDFQDLKMNLLLALAGKKFDCFEDTPEGSIIVAESLTPTEILHMRFYKVAGLILSGGGVESHVAILARNFSIPTVVAISNIVDICTVGQQIIVDGGSGEIFIEPDAQKLEEYQGRCYQYLQLYRQYEMLKGIDCVSSDGVAVRLSISAASVHEVRKAQELDADGIGLLRSEFIFMEHNEAPSEDEQDQAYSLIAKQLRNMPLTFRLCDMGGDKSLPYLHRDKEDNPFLGQRGIRLYMDHEDIISTQIRSALRSFHTQQLNFLIPMITNVEELFWVKNKLEQEKESLYQQGYKMAKDIRIGVMIETPAAALVCEEFFPHIDYLSFGSSDLTQYTLAVDRGNARVASLYDSLHPAVLKLMGYCSQRALRANIPLSVCGSLANTLLAGPLLMGMGVNEISVAPCQFLALKALLINLSQRDCRSLFKEALLLNDPISVRQLLHQWLKKQGLLNMAK